MCYKIFLTLCFSFLLISCSTKPGPWPKKKINSELYTRDSLYISITITQDSERNPAREFSQTTTENVFVDIILYSPDTLKLFSAIIEEKRLSSDVYEELEKDLLRYTGRGVAGYRSDTSQPWKLYYLPLISTSTENYEETSFRLRAYFLDQIKRHEFSVVLEDSTNATVPMRYSVADPDFWEGPLWTKGNRIPGRYLFETRPTGTIGFPFKNISPFKAEYPEWLLDKF